MSGTSTEATTRAQRLEAIQSSLEQRHVDSGHRIVFHALAPQDIQWLLSEVGRLEDELKRVAEHEPIYRSRIKAVLGGKS